MSLNPDGGHNNERRCAEQGELLALRKAGRARTGPLPPTDSALPRQWRTCGGGYAWERHFAGRPGSGMGLSGGDTWESRQHLGPSVIRGPVPRMLPQAANRGRIDRGNKKHEAV
jgi:hypothetical protein